ncbi:hypothetical protein FRUB_04339 [Fimbriiglobus ruber]|uniref:Uncharacterized protein n=1 Tax=Fimbriiglobus ruber TaxID=1908690 RepID=A0A225DLH2_9BACT|nr:hypothetical protein FRUB_04339 [Fimbriiglobus ruber]
MCFVSDSSNPASSELSEEWEGAAVEITSLLYGLRSVKWGRGDALKRWATAVLFQTSNAVWDRRVVEFLREATRALRIRYLVDDSAVDECVAIMKTHGLDPFRGTAAKPVVTCEYQITKVNGNDADRP